MDCILESLRRALAKQANIEIEAGAERYFKGVILFYGVAAPSLNAIYKSAASEIKKLPCAVALELAHHLLVSPFAEEKGLAIRVLNSHNKQLNAQFLDNFEPVFRTHVYDWATADGLCGKVFRSLVERREAGVVERIVAWRNDPNLWMQRMAAVSFVNVARHGAFTKEILLVCKQTVRSSERFVQLGTGWVLRELWLAEPDLVVSFIEKNYRHFSREGLRYAIEKMPKSSQRRLLRDLPRV